MGFRCLELTRLVDGSVDAGVSDQLIEGFKALDVADPSQDGGACGWSDAWDRGDVLRDLLHPFSNGLIELGSLSIE